MTYETFAALSPERTLAPPSPFGQVQIWLDPRLLDLKRTNELLAPPSTARHTRLIQLHNTGLISFHLTFIIHVPRRSTGSRHPDRLHDLQHPPSVHLQTERQTPALPKGNGLQCISLRTSRTATTSAPVGSSSRRHPSGTFSNGPRNL
ncbi:hypothetical protein FRC00_002631, partial [Tulasnella sp. 408]